MDTCSRGHANPDGTAFCSTCGLALAANQRQTPAGATATALRPDAQFDAWGQPHPDRQDAPPSAAGRRGPSGWAIGLAAFALLVVAGAGIVVYSATRQLPHDVVVNLDLYNGTEPCDVGLGYYDIPGALVEVSADGSSVGSAHLDSFGSVQGVYCRFTATVRQVPTDKSDYELTIGGARRGVLDATRSELAAAGWSWDVTLGD